MFALRWVSNKLLIHYMYACCKFYQHFALLLFSYSFLFVSVVFNFISIFFREEKCSCKFNTLPVPANHRQHNFRFVIKIIYGSIYKSTWTWFKFNWISCCCYCWCRFFALALSPSAFVFIKLFLKHVATG